MTNEYFKLTTDIRNICCFECDSKEYCRDCGVSDIFKQIKFLDGKNAQTIMEDLNEGCYICTDKNKKVKDVFYDSGRGGFKVAEYCPNCGRKLQNA